MLADVKVRNIVVSQWKNNMQIIIYDEYMRNLNIFILWKFKFIIFSSFLIHQHHLLFGLSRDELWFKYYNFLYIYLCAADAIFIFLYFFLISVFIFCGSNFFFKYNQGIFFISDWTWSMLMFCVLKFVSIFCVTKKKKNRNKIKMK